jgi:hypothetical protein
MVVAAVDVLLLFDFIAVACADDADVDDDDPSPAPPKPLAPLLDGDRFFLFINSEDDGRW